MSFLRRACPSQAALAEAASFAVCAALPIGVVLIATPAQLMLWISVASLAFLAGLGVTSSRVGARARPCLSSDQHPKTVMLF